MKLLIVPLLSLVFAFSLHAQEGHFYNTNGVAIKGYDPVAYYSQNRAVVGNVTLTFDWSGSIWKFANKENLQSFSKEPEKYAPAYGGFCAYGTSEKHLSPTDPNAWTIVNNKLYLNYNLKVKDLWIKDTAIRIRAANNYWTTLKK